MLIGSRPKTHARGSRSKTHARLLVYEWHLQIWTCVFAAVAKGCESAAKGSRKVWIPLYKICTRKHDHNSLYRFCWGAKGRERVAKVRVKGIFGEPMGTTILNNPLISSILGIRFHRNQVCFFGKDLTAASRFANDGQQTGSSLYPTWLFRLVNYK